MADGPRSRRGASKQSRAQSALARLAQLKSKGRASRAAGSSDDEDDAPIYDVVDDADYADLVAGRRAAAGGPSSPGLSAHMAGCRRAQLWPRLVVARSEPLTSRPLRLQGTS